MNIPSDDWYKNIWSLDIKNMSWTETTGSQVDFIISLLELSGTERILDIACGYGRHALEFARRGFSVTGIDITKEYVEDAKLTAKNESLSAEFFEGDVRSFKFNEEFDVVLNIADGAIGYLENDVENMKILELIASSLKKGGKSFIDICSADHARKYFPKRSWEIGNKSVSHSEFLWNEDTKRMLYGGFETPFGEVPEPVTEINYHSSTRLYSLHELKTIFQDLGISVVKAVTDFSDKAASEDSMQLQFYSVKNN